MIRVWVWYKVGSCMFWVIGVEIRYVGRLVVGFLIF